MLVDFHICISVPLSQEIHVFCEKTIYMWLSTKTSKNEESLGTREKTNCL